MHLGIKTTDLYNLLNFWEDASVMKYIAFIRGLESPSREFQSGLVET